MEPLNEVPAMGDLLAKRLMRETSVKVIPDFEELKDTKKRKEEKEWKDVIDETLKLLSEKSVATILQENADKIVSEVGIEIEIIDNNIPRGMTIDSIQSVTKYILKQKGYDAVTKTKMYNSFSLSIKRIEKE